MPKLPDISDFYTPDRAINEEVHWLLSKIQHDDARFVLPLLKKHKVQSVLEAGCGSGILASLLPAEVDYVGIDKNKWFLERARTRNGEENLKRVFTCWDVRNYQAIGEYDLVIAFAFFKHFSLEEFDAIVARVLSWGQHAAMTFQIADHDFDNGTEFHHTFTIEERVRRVIEAGGHNGIDCEWEVAEEYEITGEGKGQTIRVWTTRKEHSAEKLWEVDVRGKETITAEELLKSTVKEVPWDNHDPTIADLSRFEKHRQEAMKEQEEYLGIPLFKNKEVSLQALEVAGTLRPDLWRYTIRFNSDGTPTLYQDGKRLNCPWKIKLDWTQEKDEHGGKANTNE